MEAGRWPGECQELLGSSCSFILSHIKAKNAIELDNLEITRLMKRGSSVRVWEPSLMFLSCLCKYIYLSTCVCSYMCTCLHTDAMYSLFPNAHICLHDCAINSIVKTKCLRTSFELGPQLYFFFLFSFFDLDLVFCLWKLGRRKNPAKYEFTVENRWA